MEYYYEYSTYIIATIKSQASSLEACDCDCR